MAAKFGQPYLNVHRGDLQTILAKVVEERLPGSIRVGSRVDGVGQHEHATSASLVNGRTISGDVLIGADGVHSRVRPVVVGDQVPARFTGHVAYRMLVPRDAISAASMPRPSVSMWLRAHGHVVSYWVRGRELYNMVAVTENSEWRAEGWRIPGDVDALRRSFRGWAPQLDALFGAATDIHQWALLDHPVPRCWVRDRIALLLARRTLGERRTRFAKPIWRRRRRLSDRQLRYAARRLAGPEIRRPQATVDRRRRRP